MNHPDDLGLIRGKSPSIKSSRFMLETCFGLYASVEVSVAELYVWHRVLEW
jgi:hypothetical protein